MLFCCLGASRLSAHLPYVASLLLGGFTTCLVAFVRLWLVSAMVGVVLVSSSLMLLSAPVWVPERSVLTVVFCLGFLDFSGKPFPTVLVSGSWAILKRVWWLGLSLHVPSPPRVPHTIKMMEREQTTRHNDNDSSLAGALSYWLLYSFQCRCVSMFLGFGGQRPSNIFTLWRIFASNVGTTDKPSAKTTIQAEFGFVQVKRT